jgi:hypothetical protein
MIRSESLSILGNLANAEVSLLELDKEEERLLAEVRNKVRAKKNRIAKQSEESLEELYESIRHKFLSKYKGVSVKGDMNYKGKILDADHISKIESVKYYAAVLGGFSNGVVNFKNVVRVSAKMEVLSKTGFNEYVDEGRFLFLVSFDGTILRTCGEITVSYYSGYIESDTSLHILLDGACDSLDPILIPKGSSKYSHNINKMFDIAVFDEYFKKLMFDKYEVSSDVETRKSGYFNERD